MGIRSLLDVDNAVGTFLVAVLLVADDGFCQYDVVFLVIPSKFHRVALLGQHKAIRGLHFGNGVFAQGQRDRDLAFGAVMAGRQEIVGCLGSGGAEFHLIHLTIFAGCDSCHKVAVLVPVGALMVQRGNIAVRVDLVHRACKGILGVDELTVLVVCQDIAQLANRELAESFLVAVFFGDNVLVHVIRGVADHLPDTIALDLKLHRIGRVIVIALRSLQFLDEIATKWQFFGRFHKTVCIRVEHVRFLGSAAAGGVDHGDAGLGAVLVKLVQRKGRIGDFNSLAGFEVSFDELQIAFQFLI